MCGIAGIIGFEGRKTTASEIKTLTDVIAHRGPDGEGCWIHRTGAIGLGHRRLSILDLTDSAAQPMHFANDRLTIVFNGEIFNFAELRTELQQKGYQFHSDSDTEVLLAAYHAWGKDCLNRFNGFWSFALWDEQLQELWLARDRYGVKPLYYLHQPGEQFVFGSETIQFKYIAGYRREFDPALVSYTIQNCNGIEGLGKTIFKNIVQLKPGHQLTVKLSGELKEVNWWTTADHLVAVPAGYDEQVADFKALFEDAVKLRLRSDVNIASALSGGLDSSAVYACIHKLASQNRQIYRTPKEWQRAFVAVFPGTEQDERAYAEAVLEHTGGQGVFVDCNTGNDLPQTIINSIKTYDVIYSTPLFVLEGIYGAMKSQGITVSMDGHGVDEMMYGYPYNVLNALPFARKKMKLAMARDIRDTYLSMLQPGEQLRQMRILGKNRLSGYINRKLNELKGKPQEDPLLQNWFYPHLLKGMQLSKQEVPGLFRDSEAVLYDSFHFTSLPTILRNFDLVSMKNSIEIRMPFLDYRLVSYVFSLSMQSKLGGGFTKRILRDAMKGILPEPVRTRKLKTGFNAPFQSWYKNELKQMILDEVNSVSFVQSELWNGPRLRDFINKKTGDEDWTEAECFKFWPVLNAHVLLKQ